MANPALKQVEPQDAGETLVDPMRAPTEITEHIVEFVSDSGEGAQTAGVLFGTVCAKMGAGVWTVELIPAEIEPPPRSREGVSGNRIRFATTEVTNMGDKADVVVAFNEQVLYSRIDQDALKPGTALFIDKVWSGHSDPTVVEAYTTAIADFKEQGLDIREIPMEEETLRYVDNPRRGKNMWTVGMLAALYSMDLQPFLDEVRSIFERKRKGEEVIQANYKLLRGGYEWGTANLVERFVIPIEPAARPRVVMNGNAAIATGAMAAGFEICSMYPITPATSASHFLAANFYQAGGFLHQAEDEIAAIGFAIGASYGGKTALTISSGPGVALKTEMIGLAVMAEIPLVIINVQRGGPSTGLPTKVEQGDLLNALFAAPGDAPKIVIAPSTIEECFHFMVMARQLAETFRGPVIVLSDANLATGQAPFPYPDLNEDWLSPPVDQSEWEKGILPYAWEAETGLSRRPVPGQKGGQYVLTGLAHDERSKIAYASDVNQHATAMRSRKLAALKATLKPPKVHGGDDGDLLVVGWGSTRGAIEEAVDQLRADGKKVSSSHLRFLSPLEPGLADIFARFGRVMTVEINYSDETTGAPLASEDRRYAQLAQLLRSATLVDVDCWSRIPGQPLPPGMVKKGILARLKGAS